MGGICAPGRDRLAGLWQNAKLETTLRSILPARFEDMRNGRASFIDRSAIDHLRKAGFDEQATVRISSRRLAASCANRRKKVGD